MDESDLGEQAATTAAVEDVVRYVKNLASVIFEERNPCDALEKVSLVITPSTKTVIRALTWSK